MKRYVDFELYDGKKICVSADDIVCIYESIEYDGRIPVETTSMCIRDVDNTVCLSSNMKEVKKKIQTESYEM